MKKLLLVLLLSSTMTSFAEESKWLCGAEDSAGFIWRNEGWANVGFLPEDGMFTLNDNEAALQMGESIFVLTCETQDSRVYCHNETQNFIMDKSTGRAGFSSLMGALIQSNSFINLFQCTNIE